MSGVARTRPGVDYEECDRGALSACWCCIVGLARPGSSFIRGALAQIPLAPKGNVCLIAGVNVQPGSILRRTSHLPLSALSGALAVLLLVAMTLSVSHTLHSLLHRDLAGNGHLCLACSLIKGQVSAAAVALVSTVLVLGCFWVICLVHTTPFCGFDYRTSPSRAPPPT